MEPSKSFHQGQELDWDWKPSEEGLFSLIYRSKNACRSVAYYLFIYLFTYYLFLSSIMIFYVVT